MQLLRFLKSPSNITLIEFNETGSNKVNMHENRDKSLPYPVNGVGHCCISLCPNGYAQKRVEMGPWKIYYLENMETSNL